MMQEFLATETDSGTAETMLKRLAERHNACYEVWPCVVVLQGKLVKVGFELELCGTNEDGGCRLCPGCPRCKATFADLRQIAESVIPRQGGALHCEVRPHDASLHGSRKRGFRSEVVLCIKILHADGFDQPEDCLKQMCGRLAEVGVQPAN